METSLIEQLNRSKVAGKKLLAVLFDPDDDLRVTEHAARQCAECGADLIFVGGSLVSRGYTDDTIQVIRRHCSAPVILFPGHEMQISESADAILFLSLISGRNPEYLIGKHVSAAPKLWQSHLQVIPTSYILIDGGRITSVQYISNTVPVPSDKPDIALATAQAGQLLGHQITYLDAGSGAQMSVSEEMIRRVSENTSIPLIVGGGIRDAQTAKTLYDSGADILVIGNAAAEDPGLIAGIAACR